MKLSIHDFDYVLDDALIAQFPLPDRRASRLMVVDKTKRHYSHHQFSNILDLVTSNDLLVFNNTRVIPARLYGVKASGGRVECLVERILDDKRALVHLRASKSPKPGTELVFAEVLKAKVLGRRDALFELEFCTELPLLSCLEQYGEMPLPPYMQRSAIDSDKERYQTVFAERPGAVAAPTASLHFDEALLDELTARGVASVKITLHVGAGTFMPVKTDDIDAHVMHQEFIDVSQSAVDQILACKARGGRVFAIGTTVMRALETAALSGELRPYVGDTQIFIKPGFEFNCVDALLTNFHLPKSTLLMLVSAFADNDLVKSAYQAAIQERYRFFSYGDAMLVL